MNSERNPKLLPIGNAFGNEKVFIMKKTLPIQEMSPNDPNKIVRKITLSDKGNIFSFKFPDKIIIQKFTTKQMLNDAKGIGDK